MVLFSDFSLILKSRIPEHSQKQLEGTKIFILDALHGSVNSISFSLILLSDKRHLSHFSIFQSVASVMRVMPEVAFFVGFTHRVDHDVWQEKIGLLSKMHIDADHADSFEGKLPVFVEDCQKRATLNAEVAHRSIKSRPQMHIAWDGCRVFLNAK